MKQAFEQRRGVVAGAIAPIGPKDLEKRGRVPEPAARKKGATARARVRWRRRTSPVASHRSVHRGADAFDRTLLPDAQREADQRGGGGERRAERE
ncbi:TPA: hypothetical protein QDC35_005194, partial [Burkholderia aenigmatica]|nr:hypothetical protein [Burkholderia aenigmatica]